MRRAHAVLLGSVVALAGAAPAAAAEVEFKAVEPPQPQLPTWDKPSVNVAPGDQVTWRFDGSAQAHNVEAGVETGTTPWAFDTPTLLPTPPVTRTFDAPGTYLFVCEVHSQTMRGHVIVGNAPPPPPGQQAFVNDSTPPTVLETGGLDRTAPTLRSVRVRRAARGATVRFRVSELSRVTVRFKRGSKVVKTVKRNASGNYRGTIRGGLRAGRYRVELRAEDVAGNRSGVRSARVTLR